MYYYCCLPEGIYFFFAHALRACGKEFIFGDGKKFFSNRAAVFAGKIGGTPIRIAFYIIDNSNVPALLSVKSLKKLEAVISFENNSIFFADIGAHAELEEANSGHLYLNILEN